MRCIGGAGRRLGSAVATLGLLAGITAAAVRAEGHADLVFTGGHVLTMDAQGRTASAVAVAAGRVVYAGDDAGAEALAAPDAERIDLAGRTLLPGLTDAHVHPAWGEFLLRRLCNVQSYTLEEGYAKLAECARKAPPGDWVVGYGWYMTDNPDLGKVDRQALDAIVPDRNAVVVSRDHHTFWVNSKTLRTLGVTRDTPDPAGGSYDRDPVTGELNGVLHDAANRPLTAMIHRQSSYAADTANLYGTAIPYLNSLGITSLLDALVDDDAEAAYHALDARGELPMNVSLAFMATADNFRTEIPRIAAKRAKQSAHTRVDYVKLFADGNHEDNLAFMLGADGKPDEKTRGYFTQAQMDEAVAIAEKNGLSVFVHVIGDAAARMALDAVAQARARGPCAHCRHTLTHLQWVHPDDLPRFKALGVTANLQEAWIAPRAFGGPPGYDYARDMAKGPIGPRLAAANFPYGDLHKAGAVLAAGSDWFFTDENPWHAIAIGATSRDFEAPQTPPMLPSQTIDTATLLAAHVTGGAWQMQDSRRGSIAPGQAADLVMIDRDPLAATPEALYRTKVVGTWFEGRRVWPR